MTGFGVGLWGGRVSGFTLGVEWAHGFGVFKSAIAWSIWVWLIVGGRGGRGYGLAWAWG